MLRFVIALVLAAGLASAAPLVTGGGFVVGGSSVLGSGSAPGQALDSRELLQNPGFESGSMEPWETTNWVVTSIYPHSGTYCACDVGDYPITQMVDTTQGSEVQSVTFWARQPEAPAAQAYCFLYSDGSSETFTHFPPANWQQFDVTNKVNTGKSLVGFRLWGYSGGGPAPDSTYVDDVSILVPGGVHDVAVTEILCPRDTIFLDSTYIPTCRVANLGTEAESVRTVMMIEELDLEPHYWDTTDVNIEPGDTGDVSFAPYQPDSEAQHQVSAWTTLAGDINGLNDTLRQFFWVVGEVAVAEQGPLRAGARLGVSVMSAAELRAVMSDRGCSVRDASGRLAVEPRPGVYFVQAIGLVRKIVVSK
jgi:hypothetical protein